MLKRYYKRYIPARHKGASIVEYGVLVALVSAIAIGSLGPLGLLLSSTFFSAQSGIQSALSTSQGGPPAPAPASDAHDGFAPAGACQDGDPSGFDGYSMNGSEPSNCYNAGLGGSNINGAAAADSIYGGNDDTNTDNFNGNGGDDALYGLSGPDILSGGPGNDTIYAGSGNDQIFGGDNNDHIWGGWGNDSMQGDNGLDIFYFRPGDGNDTIQSFDINAGGDLINFASYPSMDSFSDVTSRWSDNGADTTITFDDGGSLLIQGRKMTDLNSTHFQF